MAEAVARAHGHDPALVQRLPAASGVYVWVWLTPVVCNYFGPSHERKAAASGVKSGRLMMCCWLCGWQAVP